MHAETAVEIRGPLPRIVQLGADVERWPQILPHYRWVRLLDGGGDRKVVEMAARRGRIPVRWRAVQEIDRSGATPVIAYRHIWGVTRGMDVAWTFAERADGVRVAIRHDFRPPLAAGRGRGRRPHHRAPLRRATSPTQTLGTIKAHRRARGRMTRAVTS